MTSIENNSKKHNPIAIWLYIGVFMLLFQIVLGGITRLTESGLSITEWKPITGFMPPLSVADWQTEFDKYKTTSQFQHIHADFTLSDFKKIFLWEWGHRNWARLMGLVFIVGFVYFLVKKKFKKDMILPMVVLFFLGAIQGAIGWIMVKSGLVPEKLFVGHIQLATHFVAALVLLAYTFWFALRLSVKPSSYIMNKPLRQFSLAILVILFIQLTYGAFMAGLHAAAFSPTWPDINSMIIPHGMFKDSPVWTNLFYNVTTIHFIHRGLAYILFFLTMIWVFKALKIEASWLFQKTRVLPALLITLQIILGIFTVIFSPYGDSLVYFGVAHQAVGILLLLSFILIVFILRKEKA